MKLFHRHSLAERESLGVASDNSIKIVEKIRTIVIEMKKRLSISHARLILFGKVSGRLEIEFEDKKQIGLI